ncbi:hypothetical protein FKM82_013530 [Ascaphus truei]
MTSRGAMYLTFSIFTNDPFSFSSISLMILQSDKLCSSNLVTFSTILSVICLSLKLCSVKRASCIHQLVKFLKFSQDFLLLTLYF